MYVPHMCMCGKLVARYGIVNRAKLMLMPIVVAVAKAITKWQGEQNGILIKFKLYLLLLNCNVLPCTHTNTHTHTRNAIKLYTHLNTHTPTHTAHTVSRQLGLCLSCMQTVKHFFACCLALIKSADYNNSNKNNK